MGVGTILLLCCLRVAGILLIWTLFLGSVTVYKGKSESICKLIGSQALYALGHSWGGTLDKVKGV
jgi:hypothetical protein